MTIDERSLILGAENHLVATLTSARATGAGPPRFIAVLSNSGVIPRSGPHRMNVHLARRFAHMGIASVRFDLSGLGDSRRVAGTLPAMKQWVADTRSVMDSAQAHFGCDRFFMIGFCSGAEVAYLVALEDPRMRAAVLWDSHVYPTLQSMLRTTLYRFRRAGLQGAVRVVARAFRIIRSLGLSGARSNDGATETSLAPTLEEYAQRIQTLVDAGVELMFAFSGGEPQGFNHQGQFRGMFGRFGFVDKVAFDYLERSDHLITRREAQTLFSDMVVRWLEERVLGSPDSDLAPVGRSAILKIPPI
jgi:pimeloyl-ACP methyl ester carboxylesterase